MKKMEESLQVVLELVLNTTAGTVEQLALEKGQEAIPEAPPTRASMVIATGKERTTET